MNKKSALVLLTVIFCIGLGCSKGKNLNLDKSSVESQPDLTNQSTSTLSNSILTSSLSCGLSAEALSANRLVDSSSVPLAPPPFFSITLKSSEVVAIYSLSLSPTPGALILAQQLPATKALNHSFSIGVNAFEKNTLKATVQNAKGETASCEIALRVTAVVQPPPPVVVPQPSVAVGPPLVVPVLSEAEKAMLNQVYLDILERTPYQSEIDSQKARILSGTSFQTIRKSLSDTQECMAKIDQLYRAILGRAAEPEGMAYFQGYLANNHNFADARLFMVTYGTECTDKINKIYRDILGRDSDPSGLTYFKNTLVAGKTLMDVRTEVGHSAECQTKLNALYRELLARDIEPGGAAYWSEYLISGHTLVDVRTEILNSAEYKSKH